jgi:hypothetical protein
MSTAIAASTAACSRERATDAASTSSIRPDSSSARSARTAARMPHAAATMTPEPPTRQPT